MTRNSDIEQKFHEFMEAAGVPTTEFDPSFCVKMVRAMMISFHKYGRVALAYPDKFDATSDVRTRMSKYRETGNKWYLVDAANFAMIEAMHPRHAEAHWGRNDADNSPGRNRVEGRVLSKEDNKGDRSYDTELHHPSDYEDK